MIMDEELCVLLKFQNEKGFTAIGYMEWISWDLNYEQVLEKLKKWIWDTRDVAKRPTHNSPRFNV